MRRLHVLALIVLSAVGVLGSVSTAQAAPTDPFVFKGTIDSGGLFSSTGSIAVNHATGNVLVFDPNQGTISQFDGNGNPVDFGALGSSTISGLTPPFFAERQNIYVDNSGGPDQGTIYAFASVSIANSDARIWAFKPNGEQAWSPNPRNLQDQPVSGYVLSIAPGANGNLWMWMTDVPNFEPPSGHNFLGLLSLSGEQIGSMKAITGVQSYLPGAGTDSIGSIIADALGNVYVPGPESLSRFDSNDNFTNEGETGLPPARYLAVDPSTNDLYQRSAGKVIGVHYSDPVAKATPYEAVIGVRQDGGIAFDSTGQTLYVGEGSRVGVYHREPPSAPTVVGDLVANTVRLSNADFSGEIVSGGARATYHLEYGTTTAYGQRTPERDTPFSPFGVEVAEALGGLQPGTTYHVRLVATNSAGTTPGSDKIITTYSVPGAGEDTCPNALARKQTIAQRLPDCRAYELVSAADTGGYDVESYLAPGQNPFAGFPVANDRVLYAIHAGAVPGPWNATNNGSDPYLASRTSSGWTTDYEGLPADVNPEAGSFSSVLGEADSSLSTFAFVGQNLCDPCFTGGGLKTGIPLRLPSGQLVQGMTGSQAGSVPDTAKPEGKVPKYFSGDGKHLIFASKYAFEPGANSGGDLTVYDRNLSTGTTQIASTDGSGSPLTGTVSELDVSANGSRIVSAKQISADGQGNAYTHPYMHIGTSPNSVDLAPGTTSGVLFAGMNSDGSKVFFTSADQLLAGDTDTSADLYEASVDGSGNLELALVTETNFDACSPVSNSNGEHWNTTGSSANCEVVAISGGGGLASGSGTIYFLSPESFGGKGTLDQPNLYLAQPGGSPDFVATLEPDNPLVLDSVKASAARKTGNFQTTPNGNYAVFTSVLSLTNVDFSVVRKVFRYDAASGQLACPSCDTSGGVSILSTKAELAPNGLSLLADGRMFFTTTFPLVANDLNGKKDVYEYTAQGKRELISSGTGPFDSALLSASTGGTDVFFFTHDALASEEDRNGSLMKIYDAREGGGFFKLPPRAPCQASDECHGPSTPAGSAPDIRSSGKTTAGNVLVCPRNRVKKRGQCVKKPVQRKKKHAKKKGAAKKRAASTTGKRGGHNA